MERIKSFLASALIALVVVAGFGFGIMAIGFAVVLGGAFALAIKLTGPRLNAQAEAQAEAMAAENSQEAGAAPA